ncbi:uncharacterized protein LOC144444534 isoform X2 [Glandiceps talaboti]
MDSLTNPSYDAESLGSSNADSIDPIYQYQTPDGRVKTRKFQSQTVNDHTNLFKKKHVHASYLSRVLIIAIVALILLVIIASVTVYVIVRDTGSKAASSENSKGFVANKSEISLTNHSTVMKTDNTYTRLPTSATTNNIDRGQSSTMTGRGDSDQISASQTSTQGSEIKLEKTTTVRVTEGLESTSTMPPTTSSEMQPSVSENRESARQSTISSDSGSTSPGQMGSTTLRQAYTTIMTPPPKRSPPPPNEEEECHAGSCSNGGTCIKVTGGILCKCLPLFSGDWCQQNRQSSGGCELDCKNGGTCTETSNGFKCACPEGWIGEACSVEAPVCEEIDNPVCEDIVEYSFTSFPNHFDQSSEESRVLMGTLRDAYESDQCHPNVLLFSCFLIVPKCDSNGMYLPCRGICEEIRDSCSSLFSSIVGTEWDINCDLLPDYDCLEENKCRTVSSAICNDLHPYGGVSPSDTGSRSRSVEASDDDEESLNRMASYEGCHEHVNIFMCSVLAPECLNGVHRQPCRHFCEEVENSCMEIMENGGTIWPVQCSSVPSMDEDDTCIAISACSSRPCQNGGTCVLNSDSSYTCDCDIGWEGRNCTDNIDECLADPCENDGLCIDDIGTYTCQCSGQWSGKNCNCKDITLEECRNLPYKPYSYASQRFADFQTEEDFRQFVSSTTSYADCYDYIDVFMCSLFAPECTPEGTYRPPCRGFCEVAREKCEPVFNDGGIPWSIDCTYMPDSIDPSVCLGREYIITNAEAICGTRTIMTGQNRVVGGSDVVLGNFPWQALLTFRDNDRELCGATVIHQKWILTAAHCIDNRGPDDITVSVSIVDRRGRNSGSRVDCNVEEIHIHPDYDDEFHSYDFALLKLTQPVEFNDYIRPACLATNEQTFTDDDVWCYTTGWGAIDTTGMLTSVLQQGRVQIVDQGTCESLLFPDLLSESMICAGGEDVDSCQGDSGGPLVCPHTDGRWYLAGVTSWGVDCATSGKPGVYGRVSMATDWIDNLMYGDKTECNDDEYQCRNGDCIDIDLVCDDLPDCQDADDEESCQPKVDCVEYIDVVQGTEADITIRNNSVGCLYMISGDANIVLTFVQDLDLEVELFAIGTGDDDTNEESVIVARSEGHMNGIPYQNPTVVLLKTISMWFKMGLSMPVEDGPLVVATASTSTATECEDIVSDLLMACGPNDALCFDSEKLPMICNSVNDCGDWRDEIECTCRYSTEVRCSENGPCMSRSRYCDGIADCPFGEDEEDCDDFECYNGNIVGQRFVCDGANDCADNSDENQDCPCFTNQYECNDGSCINKNYVCDGLINCPDGEDEDDCVMMSWQSMCDDGTLIPYWKKCDRVMDCSDGSDEVGCSHCFPREYECHDYHCGPPDSRCDDFVDCSDFSDELNCDCTDEQFQCLEGFCIQSDLRCDGKTDCPGPGDNSDEDNCDDFVPSCGGNHILDTDQPMVNLNSPTEESEETYPNSMSCTWLVTLADNSDGYEYLSVDFTYLDTEVCCDGLSVGFGDDPTESDTKIGDYRGTEGRSFTFSGRKLWFKFTSDLSITAKGFNLIVAASHGRECLDGIQCANQKCVDNMYMCDDLDDCGDGTDEDTMELCREACGNWQFACTSGECIPSFHQCNGFDNCVDGSDEEECETECAEYKFTCTVSRQCVDIEKQCDGNLDCDDGSDEEACYSVRLGLEGSGSASEGTLFVSIVGEWLQVCKDVIASDGTVMEDDVWRNEYGPTICTSQLGYEEMQDVQFVDEGSSPTNGYEYAAISEYQADYSNVMFTKTSNCGSGKLVHLICKEFV